MRTLTALAALAIAPLVLVSTPAHAAPGEATVSFVGTAHLPQFPCASCHGTFDATVAAGQIVTTSGVGVITGLHAEFDYQDTCTAGQALQGHATGTATLSGIGGSLPVDVPFEWQRAGSVALITHEGNPRVVGTATFGSTGGVPTCTGGPLDATVAGGAVVVWTA